MTDELADYIRKLRDEEGMPLYFRRRTEHNFVLWYIWYGYVIIAYRADEKTATQAVSVAANVHYAIRRSKAA